MLDLSGTGNLIQRGLDDFETLAKVWFHFQDLQTMKTNTLHLTGGANIYRALFCKTSPPDLSDLSDPPTNFKHFPPASTSLDLKQHRLPSRIFKGTGTATANRQAAPPNHFFFPFPACRVLHFNPLRRCSSTGRYC